MPWVRFDDQYPIHRKVGGLSDKAFRLHTSAIFWCARNGTDGFIPAADLDDVCPKIRGAARYAAECVTRRVWHAPGETCPSEKCLAPVDNRPVDNPAEGKETAKSPSEHSHNTPTGTPVDNSCPQGVPGDGWIIHDLLDYQPAAAQTARDRQAKADRQRRWLDKRRGKDSPGDASQDDTEDDAPSPPRPEGKRGAGRPAAHANGRASPPGSPARVLTSKPPWCGECDELTRHTGNPDKPVRCPKCHVETQ